MKNTFYSAFLRLYSFVSYSQNFNAGGIHVVFSVAADTRPGYYKLAVSHTNDSWFSLNTDCGKGVTNTLNGVAYSALLPNDPHNPFIQRMSVPIEQVLWLEGKMFTGVLLKEAKRKCVLALWQSAGTTASEFHAIK